MLLYDCTEQYPDSLISRETCFQLQQEFPEYFAKCQHTQAELRERTFVNGTTHYQYQCLTCGKNIQSVKKKSVKGSVPKWDTDLVDQKTIGRTQMRKSVTARRQEVWWQKYSEYLESKAWQETRKQGLERDNYVCQECFQPAVQVHHLTYERCGCEQPEDLISLCMSCHTTIHERRPK